ncbi:36847_t:CDS:1, partial [Gigaspora margarita]
KKTNLKHLLYEHIFVGATDSPFLEPSPRFFRQVCDINQRNAAK